MANLRGHQKPGLSPVNYCRALNKPADNISPSSWARLALASALIRESPVGVMSQVRMTLCFPMGKENNVKVLHKHITLVRMEERHHIKKLLS